MEKVIGAMREDLLTKLKEAGRPVGEQEKILECAAKMIWICYEAKGCSGMILLEVGTTTGEDPVWADFDSQHQHISL